ncbi:MAG: hypothetical protein EA385_06750 [Salinarimonadaceae bacterium]|nr:MAG: hypothetical protein EA385_06750 [Salinarimonadaceae bacterium]
MDRSLISLRAALFGFVVLVAAAFSVITMVAVQDRLRDFQNAALERALTVRAQSVALNLARMLEQDWSDLRALAESVGPRDLETIRIAVNVLAGDRRRISWAGFAGLDGRVAVASADMLVNADISERLWFQRGLEGPFAGDARDAPLLDRLLGGTDEEPIRLLDLSIPVRNDAGDVAGVLALQLNFGWTGAFLVQSAQTQDLDLFLVGQDGAVIFASDGSETGQLDLPSMRAARAGRQVSQHEVWPDGQEYLSTVVPQVAYGDLPSFGWRLVARITPEAMGDSGGALTRWVLMLLLAGLAVLLTVTVAFYRLFLAPISRLANEAARQAEGEDVPPFDTRSTREAAAISSALVRLQNRDD